METGLREAFKVRELMTFLAMVRDREIAHFEAYLRCAERTDLARVLFRFHKSTMKKATSLSEKASRSFSLPINRS